MIFVKRDPGLIPEKVLRVAERAQKELEALPPEERADFIRRKSHIWRGFARYLRSVSYGKCWYSESHEPQSFLDVDHYRPKLEAKRSDEEVDGGYPWLAFSWDNFRLSAGRSNRLSKNEDTDETEGKGAWFPLLDGSPKACWDDQCEQHELPVLLDPVVKADVRLIDVMDSGMMGPSRVCVGSQKIRVKRSVELYGLNLPNLRRARLRVMRDVNRLYESLMKTLEAGEAADASLKVADLLPVNEQIEMIQEKTHPKNPYALAARSQLLKLGGGDLAMVPEESEESASV